MQQGPSAIETPGPAARALFLRLRDALRPGLFPHHVAPNGLVLLDGLEAAIGCWRLQQLEVTQLSAPVGQYGAPKPFPRLTGSPERTAGSCFARGANAFQCGA